MDVEERHCGGAAENVMPRSILPEIASGIQRCPRMEKCSKDKQVMSVRTLRDLRRKCTWQVADVSRPLVSASHIIQAVNDLFIGKDEAYIM